MKFKLYEKDFSAFKVQSDYIYGIKIQYRRQKSYQTGPSFKNVEVSMFYPVRII